MTLCFLWVSFFLRGVGKGTLRASTRTLASTLMVPVAHMSKTISGLGWTRVVTCLCQINNPNTVADLDEKQSPVKKHMVSPEVRICRRHLKIESGTLVL